MPILSVALTDFDWALGDIKADSRFDKEYQPVATLDGPRETDIIIYERIRR